MAILKELGAPESLQIIVEGESLLNDGSALVLFTLGKAKEGGRKGGRKGFRFRILRVAIPQM
jgi:CPA1 family monovalent cation:H+ antiporter